MSDDDDDIEYGITSFTTNVGGMVSVSIGGLTEGEIYPEIAEEVSKWPADKVEWVGNYAGRDFMRAKWFDVEVMSLCLPSEAETPQKLIALIESAISKTPAEYRDKLYLECIEYDSGSGPLEIKYNRWMTLAEVQKRITGLAGNYSQHVAREWEKFKRLQAKFGAK